MSDSPEESVKIIRKYADKLKLSDIFTHLCVADDAIENNFAEEKIEKFKTAAEKMLT